MPPPTALTDGRKEAQGVDGELWLPDPGQSGSGAELGRGALANNGITISMDRKSAWRDNVFVEQLWRSIKYEEVYLRAYDSVSHARATRAPHSATTWTSTTAGDHIRALMA
jgi:transposase InsO family protein